MDSVGRCVCPVACLSCLPWRENVVPRTCEKLKRTDEMSEDLEAKKVRILRKIARNLFPSSLWYVVKWMYQKHKINSVQSSWLDILLAAVPSPTFLVRGGRQIDQSSRGRIDRRSNSDTNCF